MSSKSSRLTYPTAVAALLRQNRIMPLGPGTPDETVRKVLGSLTAEKLFVPAQIVDKKAGELCLAGLWLLYDYLEECHRIAQSLETKEAAYWHAIMHRREGDFSNSKYWFRRVGEHPTFGALYEETNKLAGKKKLDDASSFLAKQSRWDPFTFVDLCEKCVRGRVADEDFPRQIQQIEWRLLFEYCQEKALGR